MRNGVVPGSRGGLPLQRLEQRGVDACDSVQAQNTPKPSPWTAKASPCGPNCRLGRAKPSPCHSRSVALRGRSRRVPARMVPMFALAMADRNRRPFVSAQDRLASPPRAPDRLRAGLALGHDRHALLELIGGLPRHPDGARRRGDLAVQCERLEEGVSLARGPAVFAARARRPRFRRCVGHPAG